MYTICRVYKLLKKQGLLFVKKMKGQIWFLPFKELIFYLQQILISVCISKHMFSNELRIQMNSVIILLSDVSDSYVTMFV